MTEDIYYEIQMSNLSALIPTKCVKVISLNLFFLKIFFSNWIHFNNTTFVLNPLINVCKKICEIMFCNLPNFVRMYVHVHHIKFNVSNSFFGLFFLRMSSRIRTWKTKTINKQYKWRVKDSPSDEIRFGEIRQITDTTAIMRSSMLDKTH